MDLARNASERAMRLGGRQSALVAQALLARAAAAAAGGAGEWTAWADQALDLAEELGDLKLEAWLLILW